MSDVFISYSHKNGDFTHRLVDALQAAGRNSWVDWEDIPRTAQWWQEIQEGIDSADTFVCILTPESLGSSVCTLEIAHTFANSKRIIPVVHIQPDAAAAFGRIAAAPIDTVLEKMLAGRDLLLLARDNWQRLGEINWVFFREEDDFDAALKQLVETLETDLPHVKMHTHLLTRAKEWEKTPDDASLLLSGDSLRAAENWLEFNADKNPPPTDLQRRYIDASTRERQRQEEERHRLDERVLNAEKARANSLPALGANRWRGDRSGAGTAGSRRCDDGEHTSVAGDGAVRNYMECLPGAAALNADSGVGTNSPTLTTTLVPQAAFATATQIAVAYGHDDDVIQSVDGVEMVQVPAGCFFMGSNNFSNTVPIQHICFEQPFWIDRFEVSNQQYQRISQETPPSIYHGDKRPVDSINWFESRDFCARRDARLPTEAEWEYAAAGPDSWPYPWGWRETLENIAAYAVVYQDETGDIGSGLRDNGRSWVGAYDLSGNVWEWTSSLYLNYPYDATDGRENPDNNTDIRVLRGGSWDASYSGIFRASLRILGFPIQGHNIFGFRCARSD